MKIKKIITALCLTLTLVFGVLALSACSGGNDGNDDPGFPKHNVSVQSDAECALSVDKTQAEFGETVTVTVDLKTTDNISTA